MRRAARVDSNQEAIVSALRSIGATVQSLASVGHGVPDLLVAINGKNYLMEVKNPEQDKTHRALTAEEAIWHQNWNAKVHIVTSVKEALAAVGAALL